MDKFPNSQPTTEAVVDQQNQANNLSHAVRIAAGSAVVSALAVGAVLGIAHADGGVATEGVGHPCNTIFQPDCAPGSTNPPKTTPETSIIVTTSTTEGTTTTTHPNSTTSTTTPEVTTTTTSTPKVTVTTVPGVTVTTASPEVPVDTTTPAVTTPGHTS